MSPIASVAIAFMSGVLVGVLVNLLADYLPARYAYQDARRNPFSTTTPAPPRLFPRGPLFAWSGIVALFGLQMPYSAPRWGRRIAVEILMPVLFVGLTLRDMTNPDLPFLLCYAALFVLIAVIDIEYRWILWDTLIPLIIVALLEIVLTPRLNLERDVLGAILAFVITGGLWLVGRVFGAFLSRRTGVGGGRTVFGSGDVYLATVGGLLVGWPEIGIGLLVMMISGGVAAAALLIARRFTRGRDRRLGRRRPRFAAIPYGPHVLIGIAAMLYFPIPMVRLMLDVLNALRGG
jgi:Flp pilus assembly protein protease CpaA